MAWPGLTGATVQPFERVSLTNATVPALPPALDGHMDNRFSCLACNQIHPVGSCRLKLAGVEHCGLCGLAHFGHGRTCPHIRSETQVARMLDALKQSTEDRDLIRQAKKYLTGVRGHLLAEQKKRSSLALGGVPYHGTPGNPGIPGASIASPVPTMDDPRLVAAQAMQSMAQFVPQPSDPVERSQY